jgi:hypothetical protein
LIELDPVWRGAEYRCVVCGLNLGWERPSGVCSDRCLRVAQGFPTVYEEATAESFAGLWRDEGGEG